MGLIMSKSIQVHCQTATMNMIVPPIMTNLVLWVAAQLAHQRSWRTTSVWRAFLLDQSCAKKQTASSSKPCRENEGSLDRSIACRSMTLSINLCFANHCNASQSLHNRLACSFVMSKHMMHCQSIASMIWDTWVVG